MPRCSYAAVESVDLCTSQSRQLGRVFVVTRRHIEEAVSCAAAGLKDILLVHEAPVAMFDKQFSAGIKVFQVHVTETMRAH